MARPIVNGEIHQQHRAQSGFTLIELLVVMAIIATLMSIVAPRYLESVDRAKEAALKTNLRMMREAIDKYRADTGSYPRELKTLVEARYLHSMPIDPITERDDDWLMAAPPLGSTATGLYDVHSNAPGLGRNGKPYVSW